MQHNSDSQMAPIDEKYHKELQWLRQNEDATKDDVRNIYDNWAAEYDKVWKRGSGLGRESTVQEGLHE